MRGHAISETSQTDLSEAARALAKGHAERAKALYDDAIRKNPTAADAWLGRGRACAMLGALGDAEFALLKAVEHHPERVDAWVALIELERDGGAPEAAAQNLETALATHPDHPDLRALVEAEEEAEQSERALDAMLEEVRDLVRDGDLGKAADVARALERESRGDARALCARAEVALAMEDQASYADIIHALTRVRRGGGPGSWDARVALARLYLREGPLQNPKVAVGIAEDAYAESGEHPRAAIGLIEAWAAVGKTTFAAALCKTVAAGDGPEADIAARILEG